MSNLSRWGVDFSYSRPTGAELKAAGATAVMLYITDPGPGNKGVSQAVIDDLAAHRIAYGFVWELGTNAALKGYAQGVADAKNAQANLNALHGPSNTRPLYFALDWDVQPDEYGAVTQYFRGINSVIGLNRTGAYGHYKVLQWLTAAKAIKKRWQTYAWSGGAIYPLLDVYQYDNGNKLGSGTVDYCHFNRSGNWGQRGVILAKPVRKPAVTPAKADPKVTYKVKSGDTLTKIAAKYGTSVAAILHLNPKIADPDVISVGQSLRIK